MFANFSFVPFFLSSRRISSFRHSGPFSRRPRLAGAGQPAGLPAGALLPPPARGPLPASHPLAGQRRTSGRLDPQP